MKKYFFLFIVLTILGSSVGYTSVFDKNKYSDEHVVIVDNGKMKKEIKLSDITETREYIHYSTGKNFKLNIPIKKVKNVLVPGEGTNVKFNESGNKAIVYDHSGQGFAIVNPNGKVIQEFSTVFTKHRENVKYKSVKDIEAMIAHDPHWLSNEEIVYINNADNAEGYSSLWKLNVNTNQSEKILDGQKMATSFYISFIDDSRIFALNHNTYNLHVLDTLNNNEEKIIELNGFSESFSPTGEYVITWPFINNGLSPNISLINLYDNTSVDIINDNLRYNGKVNWAPDGSKFVYFAQHMDSLEDVIVLYDITRKKSEIIYSPIEVKFDTINISWKDNDTILSNMTNGTSWEIKIN